MADDITVIEVDAKRIPGEMESYRFGNSLALVSFCSSPLL